MELDKIVKNIKATVVSAGRLGNALVVSPVKKSIAGLSSFMNKWKDMSDKQVKEELMYPEKRWNIWAWARKLFKLGMLTQAGGAVNLLVLLYFYATKWWANRPAAVAKLREEILSEIPAEIEIIDDKIKRAQENKDYKEAAQLKRVKAQLQLKVQQVAGQYVVA